MPQNSARTRRSLVRKAGNCADAAHEDGGHRKKATAFALIGDRFHNPDYIRAALGKTLVREAGLSIDFTDEITSLNAQTLAGYRLLILFRDGFTWPYGYGGDNCWPCYGGTEVDLISVPLLPDLPPVGPLDGNWKRFFMSPQKGENVCPWMTVTQGRVVREYVENGGAALFYHNITHIALLNAEFRKVLGAATRLHPAVRPFRIKVVNRNHPITRDVNDFVITDEQHFMEYDKDPKHVLLRSVNEDGHAFESFGTSCEAGWAYEYGKGRVCYLMPGHNISALWNPEYEKLQKNAVRWLLKESSQ